MLAKIPWRKSLKMSCFLQFDILVWVYGGLEISGVGLGGGEETKARPRCTKPYLLYTIFGGKGKTVTNALWKIPT